MPPVADVVDVLPKVKAMAVADRAMFDRGMRAFVSYVQAYAKHECSLIFRIKGEKRILTFQTHFFFTHKVLTVCASFFV